MKWSWGHGIVAVMIVFISIMTQFMIRAYHNQESLVAEDYYAQELQYQVQIDKRNNAAALGENVRVEVAPGWIQFAFPKAVLGKKVEGEVFLMRPSDERADRQVRLVIDAEGLASVDTRDLLRGAYHLRLEWSAEGMEYLLEDRIHLP